MTAAHPLPIQEGVRDLLVDLLSRGVAVDKAGSPIELDEDHPGVIAAYVTDEGALTALAAADDRFVCRAGAALSMVPAAVAEESVRRGVVPENLLDNHREVVNVLARLLNSPSTTHLRLGDLHRAPSAVPDGVAELLVDAAGRRDFAVTIEGYGSGRLSLLSS